MPAKNIVKAYQEGGFYHVYSRGVECRKIFLDDQDYSVFISYLSTYLSPREESGRSPSKLLKNFSDDVDLYCYCLMPNHFHFLLRQFTRTGATEFMRCLLTKYVMYFNRKYRRVGSLFQSNFKAVYVVSEEQLIYLSRYIHRNPAGLDPAGFMYYRYSSMPNYLKQFHQVWIKPQYIAVFFSKTNPNLSYQSFVLDSSDDSVIGDLLIDDELLQGPTLQDV